MKTGLPAFLALLMTLAAAVSLTQLSEPACAVQASATAAHAMALTACLRNLFFLYTLMPYHRFCFFYYIFTFCFFR